MKKADADSSKGITKLGNVRCLMKKSDASSSKGITKLGNVRCLMKNQMLVVAKVLPKLGNVVYCGSTYMQGVYDASAIAESINCSIDLVFI